MLRKINREQLRPFMMALIIVGIVALVFGAYRFVDAATRIQSNRAFQIQSSGQEVAPQDNGAAQALIASGIEYHALVSQRNESLIIAGTGLVILSLGFLGNDLLRPREKTVTAS
jgi:Ca2+/Na+ antiporter